MQKKRTPKLTPEAAKILEQYRSASKTGAANTENAAGPEGGDAAAPPPKPTAPPPSRIQRSGSRGK